jgi:hypothetical protein
MTFPERQNKKKLQPVHLKVKKKLRSLVKGRENNAFFYMKLLTGIAMLKEVESRWRRFQRILKVPKSTMK